MRVIFFVSDASAGSIERGELDEDGDVEAEVSCGGDSCSLVSGVRIDRPAVPCVDGSSSCLVGHHLSNQLLLAALLLDLLALLLGRLLFRLLLLQLLLFLLLQLLSLEVLLATLFLCCTRKMRSLPEVLPPSSFHHPSHRPHLLVALALPMQPPPRVLDPRLHNRQHPTRRHRPLPRHPPILREDNGELVEQG